MKRHYDIKISRNRPAPTSAEINSMKDFSGVLREVRGKSMWGRRTIYLAGLCIITGVTWFFAADRESTSVVQQIPKTSVLPVNNEPEQKKVSFINPPVPSLDIPFDTFYMDAGKEGRFRHEGSTIGISKNSLQDNEGNPIKGRVMILYREFHTPSDFLLSGIPMTYDSASRQYHFESAGMCELRAFQDGKSLKLREGKNITIRLKSNYEGIYNVYHFDEQKGNWVYKTANGKAQGKEKLKESEEAFLPVVVSPTTLPAVKSKEKDRLRKELDEVQNEIEKIKATRPKAPRRVNVELNHFDVEANLEDFPELQGFDNMVFEVDQSNRNFSPLLYQITWHDIRLQRHESEKYLMTLITTNALAQLPREERKNRKMEEKHYVPDSVSLIVYPAFEGEAYDRAREKYEKLLADYNRQLQEKLDRDAALRKAILEEEKRMQADQLRLLEEAMERQRLEEEKARRNQKRNSHDLVRTFQADNFGVWNCDNPSAIHDPAVMQVQLTDRHGRELNVIAAATVYNRKNIMMLQYINGCCGTATVSRTRDQQFFCILDGGKVATYKNQRFDVKEGDKVVLEMNVSEEAFETAEQIKAYLGFGR